MMMQDVVDYGNATRAKLGLKGEMPFLFDVMSPYLYLSCTVPEFEYPRQSLPPQFHFIGPCFPAGGDSSTVLDLPRDKPIIHVTQGTLSNDPQDLIVPTIKALADEPVHLVVTIGDRDIQELEMASLPSNVQVEQFIPHAQLLPLVDVMITNGGFNGVQTALSHGVPLVCAGKTEEKPEVCARVAWSGVGIDLKTQRPQPKQIKQAVRKILADRQYQERAQEIQRSIAETNAALDGAVLLERLASE
jgi:MGT family glycosyltransferase